MDDIELVLEQHRKETVTFYGTRNSSGTEQDKENISNCLDDRVCRLDTTDALLKDFVHITKV